MTAVQILRGTEHGTLQTAPTLPESGYLPVSVQDHALHLCPVEC